MDDIFNVIEMVDGNGNHGFQVTTWSKDEKHQALAKRIAKAFNNLDAASMVIVDWNLRYAPNEAQVEKYIASMDSQNNFAFNPNNVVKEVERSMSLIPNGAATSGINRYLFNFRPSTNDISDKARWVKASLTQPTVMLLDKVKEHRDPDEVIHLFTSLCELREMYARVGRSNYWDVSNIISKLIVSIGDAFPTVLNNIIPEQLVSFKEIQDVLDELGESEQVTKQLMLKFRTFVSLTNTAVGFASLLGEIDEFPNDYPVYVGGKELKASEVYLFMKQYI